MLMLRDRARLRTVWRRRSPRPTSFIAFEYPGFLGTSSRSNILQISVELSLFSYPRFPHLCLIITLLCFCFILFLCFSSCVCFSFFFQTLVVELSNFICFLFFYIWRSSKGSRCERNGAQRRKFITIGINFFFRFTSTVYCFFFSFSSYFYNATHSRTCPFSFEWSMTFFLVYYIYGHFICTRNGLRCSSWFCTFFFSLNTQVPCISIVVNYLANRLVRCLSED